MATTSYLYHSLGLHGYRHRSTEYVFGWIYHHVELKREKRRCKHCQARWHDLTFEGRFERTFFACPVGKKMQFVVLHGHRQRCRQCGRVLREPILFASERKRYLKSFAKFVVDLASLMPIKYVARLLGVGWDLVKGIYKAHLKKRLKKKKLSKVRYVAVDEFAVQKGHRYMTVVLDLESGEILHVAEGKDAQALIPFLKILKSRKIEIKAFAIDMGHPYRHAITQVFGDTIDIVHDPYHVVCLANRAIDELRRDLCREKSGAEKRALKGSRFVLLKGFEKLNNRGMSHLIDLMMLNEPLYKAYLLKEELRIFWSLEDRVVGERFLDGWLEQARQTKNRYFDKLAKTLERHRKGLLAYFTHRISTGPLEGLNNKIKVLKRQAYGFRDKEYFKLRLLFIHEDSLSFPG